LRGIRRDTGDVDGGNRKPVLGEDGRLPTIARAEFQNPATSGQEWHRESQFGATHGVCGFTSHMNLRPF
jgi:hypothetical protein